MGLKKEEAEMTYSKSKKAVMFYDKTTKRRFTAPLTRVTKFLIDGDLEKVDFALLVSDEES